MILTITLNPSIDVSYPIENLKIDNVNRVSDVSKTPGGKGLNVSRVLQQLGGDLTTSGFIGGHFGGYVKSELDKIELKHDYLEIDGETRTCIAILHDDGEQTEVLEAGPHIGSEDSQAFKKKFEELVKNTAIVTISGSLPKGLDETYYSELIEIAHEKGAKVLLDTSGKTLQASVSHSVKPFLIKPNEEEVKAIIETDDNLDNLNQLKEALNSEKLEGIEWVVVSLGKEGAIAKHNDTFYRATIPVVKAVNPVGSGDSTIAGFAKALDDNASDEVILKTGMTAGVLNAMSKKTGDIDPDKFDEIYDQVKVEII